MSNQADSRTVGLVVLASLVRRRRVIEMSKLQIDEGSIVSAAPDHLLAEMDDATVLLHLSSGQYFSLGGAAGKIWQLLQEPMPVSKLIKSLIDQYDVDADRCRQESLSVLEHLHAEGLLTVRLA